MERALFLDDLQERLNALAQAAPWYSGAGALRIVDHAQLVQLSRPLWLLLARDEQARLYFVAATSATDVDGGPLLDAAASPLYQCELLAWLAAQGVLATAQGGQIVWHGPSATTLGGIRQADSAHQASSNTVQRLDIGGQSAMHKVYRRPASDQHEVQASRLLSRTAPTLLPRHVADYWYCDSEGKELALGVISDYFEGQGLHADLSRSLRSLWPLVLAANSADVAAGRQDAVQAGAAQASAALVARHCAALLPELAQWQHFLQRCYRAMTQAFGPRADQPRPAFKIDAYCADAQARLARLRPQVQADPLLSSIQAAQVLGLFDALAQRCFQAGGGALTASACHGDLHLSHLLWWREAAGPQRRLIDLSPPAIDSADPAFAYGSDLLDWIALERALDYVCLDEAALALTPCGPWSQEETMQHMLHAQLDEFEADSATAGSAQAGFDAARTRLLTACAHWHGAAARALCGAGLEADAHRARFYYGRLLQELEYNYSHRRPYYRCIDFFCLKKRLSHGA